MAESRSDTSTTPKLRRFTSHEMHEMLAEKFYTGDDHTAQDAGEESQQALFCPYYENLEGPLGADWGVILNPESPKFGQVVFEHDRCGCPEDHLSNQDIASWLTGHGRHKWLALKGRVCLKCGRLEEEGMYGW